MMLDSEEKTDTIPSAFAIISISGNARKPTVALWWSLVRVPEATKNELTRVTQWTVEWIHT